MTLAIQCSLKKVISCLSKAIGKFFPAETAFYKIDKAPSQLRGANQSRERRSVPSPHAVYLDALVLALHLVVTIATGQPKSNQPQTQERHAGRLWHMNLMVDVEWIV